MNKIESNYFFFILLLFIPLFHYLEPYLSNNFNNQFLIFFVPLIWPGVAHGSLDFLIAKRLGIIESMIKKIIFLFSYLFLAICFTTLWVKKPELSLTIFLLISIFHFGISDSLVKNKISFLEIFIRGSIPISFPIYYYSEQVGIIFSHLYVNEIFFEEIKILIFNLFFFLHLCMIYFIIALIQKSEKEKINVISEIILLYFCFTYFEPFIAFSIYFCFFHSLRHLNEEKIENGVTFFQIVKKTVPFTLLVFMTSIYFFFFIDIGIQNNKFFPILFITLASLTVPHMILVCISKSIRNNIKSIS
tara:strand:+ start:2555 stop:3463 length:909 start_codon:yes stop_codon:yes gene_type:complete